MWKKYSLKTLEKALNAAMALDEHFFTKIQPLKGKVLQLVIKPINTIFFVSFSQQGIRLLDQYQNEADTCIESAPLGLIRLGLSSSAEVRSLFQGEVRISGDIELGQHIKQLFEQLDIDWEGHLARITGDVVAHQFGSLIRKGISFGQQFNHSMQLNMNEYVHDELFLLPSQMELDDFYQDVDKLSLDVERLQAHLNYLLSTH